VEDPACKRVVLYSVLTSDASESKIILFLYVTHLKILYRQAILTENGGMESAL
jgi:hypothetical protein